MMVVDRALPPAFTDVDGYASLDERAAVALQRELSGRVVRRRSGAPVRFVAGADTAVDEASGSMFAAVVVIDARTLDVVEVGRARGPVKVDYVPGLLSFREVPLLIDALSSLRCEVDLVMCDGHGLIHPRRFGLACHLGVLLSLSTIGVGKTHLLGEYGEPNRVKGSFTDVVDAGEIIGRCLRTRTGVKPVYVSVGHKIDLEGATEIALRLSRHARVPEPVRRADIEANAMRRRG